MTPADLFVSPYTKLGGLVWVPTLRKIRQRNEGRLPTAYHPFMGLGFDRRCVRFLGVNYDELVTRVQQGGTDDEILTWCFANGRRPTEAEILVWNEYMIKRGWRDTDAPADGLQSYKEQYGLGHRADILTYFDFYEVDEGRRP